MRGSLKGVILMKKLYLAGGCFWCIGDYFLMQDGVEETNCGYSGGEERNATYEQVKAQKTGHRESVEIIYDENEISLEKLLSLYFDYVDVLDEDGQMIDRGHSYSLALYYQNEEEKNLFIKKKNELEKEINDEVHVAIEPFKFFIEAEEEHQHYSFKNPEDFLKELDESGRKDHLELKQK